MNKPGFDSFPRILVSTQYMSPSPYFEALASNGLSRTLGQEVNTSPLMLQQPDEVRPLRAVSLDASYALPQFSPNHMRIDSFAHLTCCMRAYEVRSKFPLVHVSQGEKFTFDLHAFF